MLDCQLVEIKCLFFYLLYSGNELLMVLVYVNYNNPASDHKYILK